MASPPSSGPSTVASTPSITVTPDESDESHPVDLELPGAFLDRTTSLTFDLPPEDKKVYTSVRHAPERSCDSDATLNGADAPVSHRDSVSTMSEKVTPKALPQDQHQQRPESKRSPSNSFKILSDIGKNISNSNLFNRKNGQNGARKATPEHSGAATPRTPEIRELFASIRTPDLSAVNRALESLGEERKPEDEPWRIRLTSLQTELESRRVDSRRLLTQAMKQRDQGNHEVCRALCLSIVQSKPAEVDTKVYAYNILSTQASPGQALSFLQEAYRLVRENQNQRPDAHKLLGIIAILKEGAVAREGNKKMFKENGERDWEFEAFLPELETAATFPKAAAAAAAPFTPKQSLKAPVLELPKALGGGAMTPRTEKIFEWAAVREKEAGVKEAAKELDQLQR